jgi:hypothetical protein
MEDVVAETWKPTLVNPDYLVSNLGRIKVLDRRIWNAANKAYSLRKGKILTPNNNGSKHYWRIGISSETGNKSSRRTYQLHRLVAESFIPNPNNLPQVNHIDGNKDNNCVSNLEWCNQSHNLRHAYNNGLISREKESRNCHLRKLTEEQVSYIKSEFDKLILVNRGDKMRFCEEMRQKFGLKSKNTIFEILQGRTNRYVS